MTQPIELINAARKRLAPGKAAARPAVISLSDGVEEEDDADDDDAGDDADDDAEDSDAEIKAAEREARAAAAEEEGDAFVPSAHESASSIADDEEDSMDVDPIAHDKEEVEEEEEEEEAEEENKESKSEEDDEDEEKEEKYDDDPIVHVNGKGGGKERDVDATEKVLAARIAHIHMTTTPKRKVVEDAIFHLEQFPATDRYARDHAIWGTLMALMDKPLPADYKPLIWPGLLPENGWNAATDAPKIDINFDLPGDVFFHKGGLHHMPYSLGDED